MRRRKFLQQLGTAGLALPAVAGLRNVRAFAQSPSPAAPFARLASSENDRVLVIVRLFGGNDGLNTVVPYADDNYYLARSRDAQVDIALKPEQVLKIPGSDRLGFHPSLAPLLPLYEEEKVAVVQNIGYPDQDFSHFRSTDIWLSATDPEIYDESGWLGRYLEERYPAYPYVLPGDPYAIEVGTSIGRALLGHHNTMGFTLGETSYVPDKPERPTFHPSRKAAAEEEYIREGIRQSNVFLQSIIAAFERRPVNAAAYPDTAFAADVAAVGRLIAGGLRTQLYVVNMAIYDFHATQLRDQAALFDDLAPALAAFQRDMEACGLQDRVTLMTISEFGRRVTPTGSGTDHGAASMLFVIGSSVRGGLIGSEPDLSNLDGPGNLRMEIDFRQLYATMLGTWFRASDREIDAALYRPFTQLPIFRSVLTGVGTDTREINSILGPATPNPARDATTIPISGTAAGENPTLILSDASGRTILSRSIEAGARAIRVDTRHLPSGTYFYALRIDGAVRGDGSVVVVR